MTTSPWHEWEREAQLRAGTAHLADKRAAHIHTALTAQHQDFFTALPCLVAGFLDRDGWPCATLLQGQPGFVLALDATRLRIEASPPPGVEVGAPMGLLGLQWESRRRNRVNGVVAAREDQSFTVAVEQAFGNCPKYIQSHAWNPPPPSPPRTQVMDDLDGQARRLLASCDTLFVASRETGSVDVSHRGGDPGFLALEGDAVLVPDYPGNGYFNTLGNLLADDRAGLLVPDFAAGDLLRLWGRVEISWAEPRHWRFRPVKAAWTRGAISPLPPPHPPRAG